MDYKYIEQLLERYWNGETSLGEEKILRTFFSQESVPERLSPYKDLFRYEAEETATDTLGEAFDERMAVLTAESTPEQRANGEQPVRLTLTQRLMPLFKAAAVVAITLTLVDAAQVAFQANDDEAPVATERTDGSSVAMGDTLRTDSTRSLSETTILFPPLQ